jgi:putative transposase
MPEYRRVWREGGTYFFTLVMEGRAKIFENEAARGKLRRAIKECQEKWAFEMEAMVLLPDHLHMMWTLPEGDAGYSKRVAWIKRRFTALWIEGGGTEKIVSDGKRRERRRGVWQARFWEHVIRDERDWEGHLNYVHYNPVKHGYVNCPHGWEWSTFGKWVERGVYEKDWACCYEREMEGPDFGGLRVEEME